MPNGSSDDVLDLQGSVDVETADERRLSVRAYNYWASLLAGRAYPSVADLEASEIEAFRDTSILLDFSRDPQAPMLRYIGPMLRQEAGLSGMEASTADIPGRTLISRLTDHYLEIIANRAPVGFEAEFENAKGRNLLYRGILMPLSDDGATINFIFGVISWKDAGANVVPAPTRPVTSFLPETDPDEAWPEDAMELATDPDLDDIPMELDTPIAAEVEEPLDLALDAVVPVEQAAEPQVAPVVPVAAPATASPLTEILKSARTAAEQVSSVDHRSRAALYSALAQAMAFHQAAQQAPEEYLQLLEASGLTLQERAPFTPTVKLVFGAAYDKTRVTEYASVLSYCTREGIAATRLRGFLEEFDGGLKGVVKAERDSRAHARGNRRVSGAERRMARLRAAPALAHVPLTAPEAAAEFVVLVARRSADGTLDVVATLPDQGALLGSALRAAAATVRKR
jgi:hypothetical protein